MEHRFRKAAFALALLLVAAGAPVRAQDAECKVLCPPTFVFQPAWTRSHLWGHARYQDLATGEIKRLQSHDNFELLFGTYVGTQIPRVGLYLTVQWLPTATTGKNPFTDYAASTLGEAVHANDVTVSGGVTVTGLTDRDTHGWGTLGGFAGDLLSPAGRPDATSEYTHKLIASFSGTLAIFNWLPRQTWLHHVVVYAWLYDVLTGLPQAGDEIPEGERLYLDDVSAVTLQVGLTIPIAPVPH